MKVKFALLAALFICISLHAQTPHRMSYQAVIRNSNNFLISGSPVGMRISILQGGVSGVAVYVETHTTITNVNGLATIEIGGGTVVSGAFANINWGNGPYFIKSETDPTGGSSYTIIGTSQLLSVPYALHAKTAESVSGGGGGSSSHYVGEVYGGGVVFYVYRDANDIEHGLIITLVELGNAPWSLTNIDIPNCENSWDGQANTNAIIAAGGLSTHAAGLCNASTLGGQTDWYLPAIEEFNLLRSNLYAVNRVLKSLPGAEEIAAEENSGLPYWTSNEENFQLAYSYFFYYENTTPFLFGKDGTLRVRAIRSF